LVALIGKMMDKEPANRYQLPGELADDLGPFTVTPIGPPPEIEMPVLSRAATGNPSSEPSVEIAPGEKLDVSPTPRLPQGGPNTKPPSGPENKPSYGSETTAAGNNTPVTPVPKGRQNASGRSSSADAPPQGEARTSPGRTAPNLPTPRRPAPPAAKDPASAPNAGADETSEVIFEPAGLSAQKSSKHSSSDRNRRRVLVVCGALAGVVVAVVGVIMVVNPLTRPSEPPARKPLEITGDTMTKTGPFTFRTIRDALFKAKKGDVIYLNDEIHNE
jgi:hypothetical protein